MVIRGEHICGTTIDDVHFKLIRRLFQVGRVSIIASGSYEGHKRLQFDLVSFGIQYPYTRPLSPQMPIGVPLPTSNQAIDEYFINYLLREDVNANEVYTYGQYIGPQIPGVLNKLRSGIDLVSRDGVTNQATINVGDLNSINQSDPPCLRMIDCFIIENKLHFLVYFRSWDLWGGLPENLGGLQLLKEYLAVGAEVGDGELHAFSKGLHLYDFQWPVALARLHGQMPENAVITKEEAELGEGWMHL